jgi:hypothetical protein
MAAIGTAESRALPGVKFAAKHKERGYSCALESYLIAIFRVAG